MAVNYNRLFNLLETKKITIPELQKSAGFSGNIITRLQRNEYIRLASIESICRVLNCKVDDILEFEEEQ